MIELDGSLGEGGGQILRTSLALSAITGQPFRLRQIRARRDKPGLRPQHLMSVQAMARVCDASAEGACLGSSALTFRPGSVRAGQYEFAIGTAGATSLVLQTVYLPLVLRGDVPSEVTLIGGTHVKASPCFDFLQTTWRAYLELMGIELTLRMERPGFYPRGGGIVRAELTPRAAPSSLSLLERKPVTSATVRSAVAGLPESIAVRQARQAFSRLEGSGLNVTSREEAWSDGPGTILAIVLDTAPVPTLYFGLGARGKPAERVADEAADQVLSYLHRTGAVDSHSADQLLLPLALAEGPSRYSLSEVTSHLLTNASIVRRFLDRRIRIEGSEGSEGVVNIE
jgi:RNA 3'-terminal phosphate cyclase (ATP)